MALRLLLRDDEKQYTISKKYFQEIGGGVYQGVVTPVILANVGMYLPKHIG